jgi:hypothetical protein
VTDAEPPTPVSANSLESVRQQAFELLLKEAKSVSEGQDKERFDALIARLIFDGPGPRDDEPTAHELQMDRWRVWTTVAMVAALFLIILASIYLRSGSSLGSGAAATAAGGFVSLFSGLAGIALGWLFGSGSGTLRRGAAPKAERTGRQKPPASS